MTYGVCLSRTAGSEIEVYATGLNLDDAIRVGTQLMAELGHIELMVQRITINEAFAIFMAPAALIGADDADYASMPSVLIDEDDPEEPERVLN